MKGTARLLMVLAALYPLSLSAQGIADIVSKLKNLECFSADARFSVSLPQSDTDVVYELAMAGSATPADSYSPCSYLVDWNLHTPSGEVTGFSAYFDGNHYRYRDNRLQEYHLAWDSIPFMPRGNSLGVQASAQFADLFPQYIAGEIERMQADDRYTLKLVTGKTFNGVKAISLESVMEVNGVTVLEKDFIFDASSLLPLRIDTESNPGSITEQSVLVSYTYPGSLKCEPLSEEKLVARYPEVFEKYRESNFRIENLASTPMPTFALPTADGARYTHHRGESFQAPAVIAILDASTPFNADLISAVRSAVASLPYQAEVLWVFTSTNPDAVQAIVPQPGVGEKVLLNGRSLARDCGAASLPVIIMTGSDGVVKNVNLGFNNDLENIVLQTMALVS